MEAAVVRLPAVSRSRQVSVTEAARTVEMNADTRKLRIGEVAAANAAGTTTRETMTAVVVVASLGILRRHGRYVGNSGEHTEAAGATSMENGFTDGKRSAGNAEVEGITEAEYMRGVKRKRDGNDDTPPPPPPHPP